MRTPAASTTDGPGSPGAEGTPHLRRVRPGTAAPHGGTTGRRLPNRAGASCPEPWWFRAGVPPLIPPRSDVSTTHCTRVAEEHTLRTGRRGADQPHGSGRSTTPRSTPGRAGTRLALGSVVVSIESATIDATTLPRNHHSRPNPLQPRRTGWFVFGWFVFGRPPCAPDAVARRVRPTRTRVRPEIPGAGRCRG